MRIEEQRKKKKKGIGEKKNERVAIFVASLVGGIALQQFEDEARAALLCSQG